MALQFQRNADVYIECMNTARTSVLTTWKVPVLEGFSFSQSINSSEITINEAGETSRRARLLFNDSLAPAEWSFSTYVRPAVDGNVLAPEQALWAMMFGAKRFLGNTYSGIAESTSTVITAATRATSVVTVTAAGHGLTSGDTVVIAGVTTPGSDTFNDTVIVTVTGIDTFTYANSGADEGATLDGDSKVTEQINVNALTGATENTFNLAASNISAMPDNWNIVFAFVDGTNKQYFRLNKAVANSASLDFDIDGIATIAWSGFSQDIQDIGTVEPSQAGSPWVNQPGDLPTAITSGIDGSDNFIRNRISTLTLLRTDTSPHDAYNIVLTGGSFSVENNITYLTPEELGKVNSPLANITGSRSITGSVTCYFDNDQSNSKSGELFADLVSDSDTVRNVFNMAVNVGGVATGVPRLVLSLPTAHLEVPTINVEDLLTLEVSFHGQVADGDVDSTNEATIVYKV
jgi:hypothetical protein